MGIPSSSFSFTERCRESLFIKIYSFRLETKNFGHANIKIPILFRMGTEYIEGEPHLDLLAYFFEDDTGVMPAKTKSITQRNINFPFLGLVQRKI